MAEISVEVQGEDGQIKRQQRFVLPQTYDEFMKNKFQAISFFLIHPSTSKLIEQEDQNFLVDYVNNYKNLLFFMNLFVCFSNFQVMRSLKQQNLIFALTSRFNSLKFLMKYYFIPKLAVGIVDIFYLRPMVDNNIENHFQKYDFTEEQFKEAYLEVLSSKQLTVSDISLL